VPGHERRIGIGCDSAFWSGNRVLVPDCNCILTFDCSLISCLAFIVSPREHSTSFFYFPTGLFVVFLVYDVGDLVQLYWNII
jgi:hypothetical protein